MDAGLKTRRSPIACLLLAVTLLTIAACGSPDASQSVLNRGLGQEPESIDPHRARTTQAHEVQRDVFEGLVSYTADGQLVPGAAESWSISDDGLRYTFTLREAARWSNGDPVLAEDFVYSLRRLVDPDTAAFNAELLAMIVGVPEIVAGRAPVSSLGVEASGERTLVIRLSRHVPYFLELLTHPAAFPVHAKSVATHGEQFARAGVLVSNGAFRLTEWVLGSVIELTRNPYYWNNAGTSIDAVRHHVVQEPNVELNRYRAGELDTTSTVPSEAFASLQQTHADELHIAPAMSIYFYGINLNHDVLGSSPELREALSLAVDREALVEQVVGRGETPAYSFVPPGLNNYESPQLPFGGMSRDERLAEARRLFAAAGFGPGNLPDLELRYNTSETHRRIAVAIRGMWQQALGLEVRLVNEEFRVLVANMRAMEITQLFRLSWNGEFNDASAFLSLFQSTDPSNMFGYANDDYDRLMKQAADQIDPKLRRAYLEEAERELLGTHAVIPLYYPVSKHLVKPYVEGWQDNVRDYHYSQHLSLSDR